MYQGHAAQAYAAQKAYSATKNLTGQGAGVAAPGNLPGTAFGDTVGLGSGSRVAPAPEISGGAEAYAAQRVLTAPKEELTLLLYDGAIKFVNQSIRALADRDYQVAHNANLRAQAIVRELMVTLDTQFEIAGNLMALYDYVEYRLIQGNIKKDPEQLSEAREMLQELRETWAQAVKTFRSQRGGRQPEGQG
ncbi:MAG: flagellar export chaperone FliS [Heliobacteriaceae bacterium]|nr:flagellar export chaperone FliS [Heliobacteriaceae bacterium]MDD4588503.1 flagellar export chaperone FliS [Heliobacteriaceae bacterium]